MKGVKGAFARRLASKNAQNSAPAPVNPVPVAPTVTAPPQWESTRFNVHLKMAKNRIDIQRGKKENEIEATRNLIAGHLAANKEPLARIQADRVLRERVQLDAFDMVITFVNLLSDNNSVFKVQRDFDTAPTNIKEAVASVVYASGRLNVPELHVVTDMFRSHFGATVVDSLLRLEGPHVPLVNKILARFLEAGTPDGVRVLEELTNIAKEKQLDWIPPPEDIDLDRGPYGASDPSYYRPMPMMFPPGGGPGGPGVPPPPTGGPGGYGAPMNIPGHNPYGAAPPFGGISDTASSPSIPPSAPPPTAPFEPPGMGGDGAYPYPGPPPSSQGGSGLFPPPPPPASFLSDDALEAKYRNIRDNYGKK